MSAFPLLDTVDHPAALRCLERRQLPQLADELRRFLIESVSRTGGHLSSNLGRVELTIALHAVYDTPEYPLFAMEFADPAGSKMADDNDPFGTPTPRHISLIGIIVTSMMSIGGLWAFAKACGPCLDSTLNTSH